MGFFALALVGWASGLSPFVCGMRALGGAAALYVLVSIAGRLVAGIVADAIVRSAMPDGKTKDAAGDKQ
jgi:hypothetical protein